MNNNEERNLEFLGMDGGDDERSSLGRYVSSLSPEAIAQLSQPHPEVARVMERNLVGMLGALPAEHFNVAVTTSRENLGRLLASAMMSGYFLHNAYQRMNFEQSFHGAHSTAGESDIEG